ncbi:hypothetical protein BS78_08G058500 [Paspalum vaginatum]|nr:hypothetical protein BS78_08G058500 [Paspalum vaginatum]
MFSHDWTDLHVTEWIVTEQLHESVQKDGSSCGLFMLKFMEYWNGDGLSHQISQEDINGFRYKLLSILLCWNRNTAGKDPNNSGPSNGTQGNSDDVKIIGSPDGEKRTKELCSVPDKKNYESLMSVVSKMSVHDLVSGLCSYIKSIKGAETLQSMGAEFHTIFH